MGAPFIYPYNPPRVATLVRDDAVHATLDFRL